MFRTGIPLLLHTMRRSTHLSQFMRYPFGWEPPVIVLLTWKTPRSESAVSVTYVFVESLHTYVVQSLLLPGHVQLARTPWKYHRNFSPRSEDPSECRPASLLNCSCNRRAIVSSESFSSSSLCLGEKLLRIHLDCCKIENNTRRGISNVPKLFEPRELAGSRARLAQETVSSTAAMNSSVSAS